jgi:serine/threonine-protein kinase
MTPERWRVVKDVFDGAVQQHGFARSTYLARVCGDDSALRAELDAMLASDESADGFLQDVLSGLKSEGGPHGDGACSVGSRLAHYRILSELGSGGMGRVYSAEDTRLGRKVALKVLAPEWLDSPGAHARFEREARLASALDHPNICTIYDVGHADGVSFIAMQHLAGDTLQHLLRGRPLSVDRLLSIAGQIADALATAHARGIIHRDVKSSNVIVTAEGRAHVLDFGIAKQLRLDPTIERQPTESGLVFGTPAYLSPEQARGAELDHRSDIFSFGTLLYEMATGTVPFSGASAADTIANILKEAPASASEMNPHVPPSLSRVIDRALAKDPADRYQSVDELKEDLQRVTQPAAPGLHAAFENISGRVGSGLPARSAWLIRGKVVALTTALFLVTGVAISGVYRVITSDAGVDAIAVLPFGHQKDAGDLEYLSDGIADLLIGRLSELPATRVIARSTSFLYKERHGDPRTIGQELGVAAVMTGDVSRQGETVVIRIELVEVRTGSRLWGGTFSRPMSELSSIPGDVAIAVSRQLRMRLTGEEQQRLARDYTRSPGAYDLYLKGRFFWNKRTMGDYAKAMDYFTAAVNQDPTFALAYAGLADVYLMFRGYGIRSAADTYPRAKAAAERALAIDDSLAEAHTTLGKIASDTYQWAEAESELGRALTLNPNYATAHHWHGMHLAQAGRLEEATAAMRRAQALDPLSLIINTEVGRLLYFSRQYDAAIAQYRRTLELDPEFAVSHLHLGMALVQTGSHAEALSEFEKASPVGGFMPDVGRARTYALSGRRREAEEILHGLLERAKHDFVPPYAMALLYVSLQDHERALEWLEKGARDGGAWFLKVNPPWDPLQSTPRYQAIVRSVGLTP